jgi:hypothetical protein
MGAEVFYNCTSLTSVTFQSTITSDNLDEAAFGVDGYGAGYLGDLRDKYLAGGTGTYTRPDGSSKTRTK